MAKYHGMIGFSIQSETKPGVWNDVVTEKHYSGEILKLRRKPSSSDRATSDFMIDNEISIVADPFINDNLASILYVEFMGAKWTITGVEVDPPRLILSLGGVYNG